VPLSGKLGSGPETAILAAVRRDISRAEVQAGRGKHRIAILVTLCVREIYVAMALLLPAAKPLSVIITTHKFLPFRRQTTHCMLLACFYRRGAHLPEDQPENDKPKPLCLR
jgi:hypothetical protein